MPRALGVFILRLLAGQATPEPLLLRLYQNNVLPDLEHDMGDEYDELTGGGYQAKPLYSGDWRLIAEGPVLGLDAREQRWEFSAPVSPIYGYFITGATSGGFCWAERFPHGPFLIEVPGEQVLVTPRLRLGGLGGGR
jgi:hypothetical protein